MGIKKIILGLGLLVSSSSVFSAGIIHKFNGDGPGYKYREVHISNNHHWEFDSFENPNGYYWCGHAAYKVAVEASTRGREVIPMNFLHNLFADNSYYSNHRNCGGYNSKFCASFQNLESANEHFGYNKSYSVYAPNYAVMFSYIKSSIDQGYPVITPWPYLYDGGHFWTIVGYQDHNTDDSKDRLLLRDVAIPNGSGAYDKVVDPLKFWRDGHNNGGNAMHLMFVNTD